VQPQAPGHQAAQQVVPIEQQQQQAQQHQQSVDLQQLEAQQLVNQRPLK